MADPSLRDQVTDLGSREIHSSTLKPIAFALLIGVAVIAVAFFREMQAAVEVWNASTAYSHCYLVLPMAIYLLWERRELLAGSRAEPELHWALAAVPVTIFWLMAERLGIMEARQLAVVSGVELLFLTVLGRRLFARVSGPLLFLFFLVPFGAFLTPMLQQFTATFSIVGLDLLGIPNYSDKFIIETPAGVFYVAEACAGLRFLIAAVAFGVFYALLNYTSYTKRILFIAACIVVPIVANGFRALGIVVLGQVLGSAEAAAADHLIYGWVFFSAVMLLLIAGGHVFRDDAPIEVSGPARAMAMPSGAPLRCAFGVVALLCLGPAFAGAIDSSLASPPLPTSATIVAPPGCSQRPAAPEGSSARRSFTLICDGDGFEVTVRSFAARSTSSAMIAERRRASQEIGAENAAVSVADVPDGAGHWTVVQTTDPNRVTAYAAWVDGRPVSSSMAGRIAQAYDSFFGADHFPVLITITVAEPAGSLPSRRKATLDRLSGLLRGQAELDARMATFTRNGS